MDLVVFIPGIMGTKLVLEEGGQREEVWPPTPLETRLGYGRIEKLQDPRAKPTEIITSILCFNFYSTIIDMIRDIGFVEGGNDRRLALFPYDWRLDLFDTTDALAARLDEEARDARSITLVAHSMGGLIARLLLESDRHRAKPWFGRIKLFTALAVPHLGAPLALARILGLDSTLGIKAADFAKLASNRRYPSGYQLLPSPGEFACWDQASGTLEGLDIFDDATAQRLGLDRTLLARTEAVQSVLSAGRPPPGIRYFYFAGTGHRTVTRVNVASRSDGRIDTSAGVLTWTSDGGDGTVPSYSALPRLGQRQIVTNEHSSVFAGAPFRRVFVRLLGGDEGPAIELAGPELRLSVEQPVTPKDRPIEVNLIRDDHDGGLTKIVGELVLMRFEDDSGARLAEHARVHVSYAGPALDKLSVRVPAVGRDGFYSLRWNGDPPAPEDVKFAATA